MKRYIALLLLLCAVATFFGCDVNRYSLTDPVRFHYQRKEYQYSAVDSVITSELREASGHRDDLKFLLALYMEGPQSEDLRLPFPEDTALLGVKYSGSTVTVQISDLSNRLTDQQYSLGCACLTLTCFDICKAQQVTVISGNRTYTFNRRSFLMFDQNTDNLIVEE